MQLANLAGLIISVLGYVVVLVTVYAFVHAAMQRPDAYTATGKLTKPVWLAILGVSAVLTLLVGGVFIPVIAACATGVYLVDVRPKLLEIQGKSH
ncbi:hypothetical protein B7435_15030 [Mycolicibacterium peregrinum]|uniref:DUF2516 family protein n=1 Tax=Mycolicibacterium peregrinum TaxID=43304 RepID=A0A1A0QJY7_MYCPR|nr:DUF2516 family protein [Mycolicibacterium peregrinum]MCV7206585.1 DUF2516 family protein [Mycolicibacterium peregrinum]OBB22218.1 hypothetical protein A5792_06845 [Mycolicibacterium peregrinum]OBF46099.1 hypothetical protein A5719_01070 [Mycolicibacterium peregrinum]ORW54282.1 hypothetical protein AWC21_25480 [Mycolicibacterium peregrinum]OWM02200.1 hypothetical protein B7435_15030 [Mycolicibacterium peregrinum]